MNDRSPALDRQSGHYPPAWRGRVPVRVRMAVEVGPDQPWGHLVALGLVEAPKFVAEEGQEYDAWVNKHGAVAVVLPDGTRLGVRPYEFEVIEWDEATGARRAAYAGWAPATTVAVSGSAWTAGEGRDG